MIGRRRQEVFHRLHLLLLNPAFTSRINKDQSETLEDGEKVEEEELLVLVALQGQLLLQV